MNPDEIFDKVKSRFYVFHRFKAFGPPLKQCPYFIKSLIFPVLLYNSKLWFYSSTEGDRHLILSPFKPASFKL